MIFAYDPNIMCYTFIFAKNENGFRYALRLALVYVHDNATFLKIK